MRILLVVLAGVLSLSAARAAVVPYESISGTEITFEDAAFDTGFGYRSSHALDTLYSPLGVHFFEAFAFGVSPDTWLFNGQPHPCLLVGCPDVRVLPPVSSPLASDTQWRPMWVTFDAPITEFGFQEVALPVANFFPAGAVDSIHVYRAGVFVGEESFTLPAGIGNQGVAVRFTTPFDLVVLDRYVVTGTGSRLFVYGPDPIDNVRFAPAIVGPIPEPSAWLLFSLGSIAVALRSRRRGLRLDGCLGQRLLPNRILRTQAAPSDQHKHRD